MCHKSDARQICFKIHTCTLNVENDIKVRKKITKQLKMMSMSNQFQKAGIFLHITKVLIIKLGNE